jgi:hypothetical protein
VDGHTDRNYGHYYITHYCRENNKEKCLVSRFIQHFSLFVVDILVIVVVDILVIVVVDILVHHNSSLYYFMLLLILLMSFKLNDYILEYIKFMK